ncbi:MAG TPA: LysE family transporter [Thermoanaerobaculia bacterium]|nr:LysE family transporter [Thermoanaerobaculia bacterium]
MPVSTWLLFLATELVLCLTPGPAVLFVFSHGLRYGGRHSLWANLGILSGNAFYFLVSATGLGMLVTASHTAFSIVKWAGAGYLIYLGLRMIFGHADAFRADAAPPVGGMTVTRRGFVLQASNPKALVFFTALLPQFVTPGQPVAMQLLILGITSIAVEFFVLALYGYGAARIAAWSKDARVAAALNRTAGAFLVACGVTLLDFAAPDAQ